MDIINYTRYSTEALQKIVSVVESMQDFRNWRMPGPLVFKEFDPKNPYITERRRRWNVNGEPLERRYVSKMSWRDMSSISLLVPRKLHDNPMEALVQDESNMVAPVAMVEQLAKNLRDRTNFSSYGLKIEGLPELPVFAKPETKLVKTVTAEAERQVRNDHARRNIKSIAWDARAAARNLHKAHSKHLKVARTHLKDRKSILDEAEQMYREAMVALARFEMVLNQAEAAV